MAVKKGWTMERGEKGKFQELGQEGKVSVKDVKAKCREEEVGRKRQR